MEETMRQNSGKTKRSLSPVLEMRVFEGVRRGPESNKGGVKEACPSTVRKVLRKLVEHAKGLVYVRRG